MRITIIAPGSRGDVQPYLALGKGLQKDGHVVRLVTHQNFESFIIQHGIDFWPFEGNVQDIAQSADMRNVLVKGNFIAVISQMAKEARRGALALAKGGLAACRDTDLILAGLGGLFIGAALAEKLEIPLLQAYYIPFTPTRAYPSFLLNGLSHWHNAAVNRLSYYLTQQVVWQGFRAADKIARRQVLDLRPAPFWGPFAADCMDHMPILYGYSPHVIPKPPDWRENIQVTGYWFLDEDTDWVPPTALQEFIESGPRPIYIGFGSMSSQNPAETANLIFQALARTGQRGIVLSGWGGIHATDVPDNVFMVESVPFSWLFPRVAAVVHHGGAGTTSIGLRAGVPSIVIPFFGDQPYWGQRVAELGVGPEPIPRRKLTAARLAETIHSTVNDPEMRQRALKLGKVISAENGVARAVAVVRQYIA